MSLPDEIEERSYRILYQSPILSVQDYSCHPLSASAGDEEESSANNIVLMRHGAFTRHFGKLATTADVNQAVFFSKDSTYRVSHPTDCGDRGTVFTISPRVLNDIVRELDPTIDDHPEQPFQFITGPCSGEVFFRHRELVRRLEFAETDPPEPLWADVTALQIVADVLGSAFEQKDGLAKHKPTTRQDHVDRTEAVKTYLAGRFGERITLDEVARAVHASPYHLARIFQHETGVPVHRYLTQLRLRASLERLAEGVTDLTGLALELGFSSHSHFTDAFRKEFGCSPSQFRIG